MPDSLPNHGSLGQDAVDRVVARHRDNHEHREAANAACKDRLGDAMDQMFGLSPKEVEIMNAIPDDMKHYIVDSCDYAIKHPNGKIRYTRSESGGPKLEVTTTHTHDHSTDGTPGKHHVAVNVHCMK